MDFSLLDDMIETARDDLSVHEVGLLNENVGRLIERCVFRLSDQNKGHLIRNIWIRLIAESILIRNIELSLLAITRLNLGLLTTLISPLVSSRIKMQNEQLAFHYIADYFAIEYKSEKPTIEWSHEGVLFDFDNQKLIDCSIYNDTEFPEDSSVNGTDSHRITYQKELIGRLADHNSARFDEIDENFKNALTKYERSGTYEEHLPRMLMKHLMGSTHQVLEQICADASQALRRFWSQYSKYCLDRDIEMDIETGKLCFSNNSSHRVKGSVIDTLPKRQQEFINDSNAEKFFNKNKIHFMISIGSTQDKATRSSLAQLASLNLKYSRRLVACGIYLCLEQVETFLDQSKEFFNHADNLKVAIQLGGASRVRDSCISYLCLLNSASESNKRYRASDVSSLLHACIRMGLLNELLQIYTRTIVQRNESTLELAIEQVKKMIDDRHSGSLLTIDAELRSSTIYSIRYLLEDNSNKYSTTNLITLMILSITVLLWKIDATDARFDESISKLEIIFEGAVGCYDGTFQYTASDLLIGATKSLIVAVKAKLEAISDSNSIRESFRQLISSTADLCMVEGQYRSAASLYGQIEDNMNAVKSLMRMEEVEAVIEFALSVRDITVNRITINYLRHLNIESSIIEDFIARSN